MIGRHIRSIARCLCNNNVDRSHTNMLSSVVWMDGSRGYVPWAIAGIAEPTKMLKLYAEKCVKMRKYSRYLASFTDFADVSHKYPRQHWNVCCSLQLVVISKNDHWHKVYMNQYDTHFFVVYSNVSQLIFHLALPHFSVRTVYSRSRTAWLTKCRAKTDRRNE